MLKPVIDISYLNEGSLKELIEKMENPSNDLSDNDYFQLVVKYFMAFVKWIYGADSTNIIHDISYYRQIIEEFDVRSRNFNMVTTSITGKTFSSDRIPRYQLEMLIDIGTTMAIVKDIVSRVLQKKDTYTGIDLWTGTWILMVAQYLQARRNWVKPDNIRNYGIELNGDVARRTQHLIEKCLQLWHVLDADTTNPAIYKSIPADFWVDFVSNENIPNPEALFYSVILPNGWEPFFRNIIALQESWRFDLSHTQIFPAWITVKKFLGHDHIVMNGIAQMLEETHKFPWSEPLLRARQFETWLEPIAIALLWENDRHIELRKVRMKYIWITSGRLNRRW